MSTVSERLLRLVSASAGEESMRSAEAIAQNRAADPGSTTEEVARFLHDESATVRSLAAMNPSATTDQLEVALLDHPDLAPTVRLHDNAPLRLVSELAYIDTSPRAQERYVTAVDGDDSRLVSFRASMRDLNPAKRSSLTMAAAWREFLAETVANRRADPASD